MSAPNQVDRPTFDQNGNSLNLPPVVNPTELNLHDFLSLKWGQVEQFHNQVQLYSVGTVHGKFSQLGDTLDGVKQQIATIVSSIAQNAPGSPLRSSPSKRGRDESSSSDIFDGSEPFEHIPLTEERIRDYFGSSYATDLLDLTELVPQQSQFDVSIVPPAKVQRNQPSKGSYAETLISNLRFDITRLETRLNSDLRKGCDRSARFSAIKKETNTEIKRALGLLLAKDDDPDQLKLNITQIVEMGKTFYKYICAQEKQFFGCCNSKLLTDVLHSLMDRIAAKTDQPFVDELFRDINNNN
jgi:hypothetical protein